MAGAGRVGIVVLNWNGRDDTLRCLQSLRRLAYPDIDVVVVDNGSSDGSQPLLRAVCRESGWELIEAGHNHGYAEGNNIGIRRALERGADFVMLLNNDTVVDSRILDALLGAARARPEFAVFGARLLYLDRPGVVWFDGAKWRQSALSFEYPGQGALEHECGADIRPSDYACGAAMMFRAELAKTIGLLDERFFLVFEESDWCFRARRAGYRICVVPQAKVWHKVGASFGSEASPLRTYFSARNELLWVEKNAKHGDRLRVLGRLLRQAWPRLSMLPDGRIPVAKRWLWAATSFVADLRRRLNDPQQLALRRGIADYLLRRFGDCPPAVREWSRTWAELTYKS